MQTKIRAINPDGNEEDVKSTVGGAIYTADIARIWTAKGYGWSAMATAAVASLVVRPGTTAQVTFYNNTAKNFVIERAFSHNLVAAAVTDSVLWLCVHPIGMTAPTNDITVRNSLSGLTAGTEGILDVGATVVDNGWFPWGASIYDLTVTTPGGVLNAEVAGRIVLPPTAGISMSVVSSVTTATFCGGLTYYSVPITEYTLA